MENAHTNAVDAAIHAVWRNFTAPGLVIAAGIVGWVILVRSLRWRRYHAIHRTYGPKWDNGRGSISPGEAQKIMAVSTQYDMPFLMDNALAFALFKTNAIPSISKLLAATTHPSPALLSRRFSDVSRISATWLGCPITGFQDLDFESNTVGLPDAKPTSFEDPRANIAIARTNWLHSKYKISNDDYLYSLCLYILEPARWAEQVGWRALSPLEKESFYVFWCEVASRMGIKDVPESLAELEAWSTAYEERCMVPTENNRDLALRTIDEQVLSAVPTIFGLKTFAKKCFISTLDDLVREATMQPKQPAYLTSLMNGILVLVGFVQGWFMLPRSDENFHHPVDIRYPVKDGKVCPRMVPNIFAPHPWYRPEQSGLLKIWDRILVGLGWYHEMPGPQSNGYRLEEMGSLQFENSGREEVMRMAEELQGRPIASIWQKDG
ncbi:hypothetical protein CVT24_007487 [Panaeolus cyanescens]|uniref:ER-bound oxygenase mpaB/mpaB'/Rubber oxygenase catalytic domain-containing protein n=1 Tax=Panaeolus cyanescens TaxID=181874 RepID=A0A409W9I9_9AGAR|nr:hypothetical protein CVT24_007487 [Panaeolus cyanescens]